MPWEWPGVSTDVAVVAAEAGGGILAGFGGGLRRAGGLDGLGCGLEVFAGLQGLSECGGGIGLIEGGVGDRIGEAEVLVEREADGAGEGQPVLGELVGGGDEGLLLVLVVDLGAEDVEAGAGAGVVGGGGLIERDLGGGEFGVDGFDAGLIGDAEEIGVADGEDDEVAGIIGGELGAGEVVLGGDVVLDEEMLTRFWVR